jgi:hypothetical protein
MQKVQKEETFNFWMGHSSSRTHAPFQSFSEVLYQGLSWCMARAECFIFL